MEVCVDSVESAVNAERGGILQVVKQSVQIPVFVMIRPRGGDFLYSDREVEVMKADIRLAKLYGADGLVFGALTEDGHIDKELCMSLVALCRPLPVTFHRVWQAKHVQVMVKQTERETWSLWADLYSRISKMKAEIRRKNDILGELCLSFQEPQGDRQLLSSQKTPRDYGIFSKVTVRVLETFPPEIQVFVKDSSGQSKPYASDPDASIYDLKMKIEDAGGLYTQDQVLLLEDEELEDYCSLAELQIKDCDTIQLTFDMVHDPMAALETLLTLGFERVLTSGCDSSALEGLPLIKQLID
ncbi:hypothetical protein A6R68_12623, partial [Neotoma lepida]